MSEGLIQRIVSEAPDALIATGMDGRVLYWNRGAESMFGYEQKEMLERTLAETIVPASELELEHQLIEEARTRGISRGEVLRQCKDGSLLQVAISRRAVPASAGQHDFLLSSEHDVTYLRLQRDARIVKGRFHDLMESVPDGLLIVNPTGRIVHANQHTVRLFGYQQNEMFGRLVEELMPERFRTVHGRHRTGFFGQLRARPMGVGLDLFGRRKEGGEFPVDISLSPLPTEEGVLVICAVRDASERKQFERMLREKNLELEKANRELESFSYSVSHDLRAPLRAIDGFSKIVLKECAEGLNEEGRQHLERVRTNAVRMGHLIDDLLEFSRLSREPLERQPVCSGELVRVCLEELQIETENRHVEVKQAELPEVQGDAGMLRQVWLNLLSNALKYTRKRDVARIEVGCQAHPAGWEFFVRDNGVGFDPQSAAQLFGVFQRMHTAQEYEGTGVGLATVQRIVHRHGGQVRAESTPGAGATFYFMLPD